MRGSLLSLIALIALGAVPLAGCKTDDSKAAQVRLLNVSPGYDSLDLYAKEDDDDSEQLKIAAVAYDAVSGYTKLDAGTYTFRLKKNGVSSTLQTLSGKKLDESTFRTVVAYGATGDFAALEIEENVAEPDNGETKVQLLNAAETGNLDVYLTESTVALEDASPVFTGIVSGADPTMVTIDSGEYRLRVTGAGDTDDLRLDVPSVTFDSKGVATLILTASDGGVLVDAALLPQKGSLTKYANTKARVRGAVAIASGGVVTARIGGVRVLNNQAPGVVGAYALVDAGSAPVTLTVDGSPVAVANQALDGGGDYTLLVWSDASGTRTTLIGDENHLPASGRAKIRIVNGLSALATAVTLHVDFSPVAEGIETGQASDYSPFDGGAEYRLDVDESSTAQRLLSKDAVSLQAAGIYTLFVSANGAAVSGTVRRDR